MDVRVRELASRQADLIAAWQLRDLGWSQSTITQHARRRGWRSIHPGVYAVTYAPLTRHQRWMAATLTAPGTYLSHLSAGARYGFIRFDDSWETVTRAGNGGPRRMGGVFVYRSTHLAGHTTVVDGLPITTAARVLVDVALRLSPRAVGRAFREAVRLKVTYAAEVLATAMEHHGRGTSLLIDLAARYATIPYHRTRSTAEARALELLHDAGVEPPLVNEKINGEEADLIWPRHRHIVEIDGADFHQFPEEDARKQRIWENAGYTVRRIPSDDIYYNPRRLMALAPC